MTVSLVPAGCSLAGTSIGLRGAKKYMAAGGSVKVKADANGVVSTARAQKLRDGFHPKNVGVSSTVEHLK